MNIYFIKSLVAESFIAAIIVFIPLIIARVIYLKRKNYTLNIRHECLLGILMFYIIMLFHITVYRYGISLERMIASRPAINMTPLTEVLKLYKHGAIWSFIYNLGGNIVWFIPLGVLLPAISRKKSFLLTVFAGFLTSLSIEVLQYVFNTGISDIDDLIFNTVGAVIGYSAYRLSVRFRKKPSH